MTALTVLEFEQQQVRTVVIDGAPWFVARDVAAVLGYADPTNAVKQHCKGVAKYHPLDTAGGTQMPRVLAEPDVLRLVMGSRLPAAERFEHWVFEEVLPSIRRTGSYAVPETREQFLARAVLESQAAIAEAHQQIAVLEPAATAWHELASADGDYSVGDAAKILARAGVETGQQRLFTQMQVLRMVYRGAADRKWRAYQAAVDAGHLTELPQTHRHPQTGAVVVDAPQVRVTARGIEHLRKRLGVLRPVDLELPDGEASA